jgi:predicted DsbA family dithiol-disulfide isomerase
VTTTTTTSTTPHTDARLRIDLWSDVVCPWCYLGAARLRKAIDASPRADSIDLVLHAYELDPGAPAEAHPNLEYLTVKFGMPAAQVEEMEAGMAARAAAEGLPYTAHRLHAGTFDIHRVLAHAADAGAAEPLMTALQRELFSGGRNVFDHAVLADLAAEAGLDRAAAAGCWPATPAPTRSGPTSPRPGASACGECRSRCSPAGWGSRGRARSTGTRRPSSARGT